jgi:metal-sulfur cluster biosynthetic enzyme
MSDETPGVERVRRELDGIVDPCSAARGTDSSVVELGLVKDVEIADGTVSVEMRVTSPGCMMVPYFHREIDERVGSLDGVTAVELTTDAGMEWHPDMMSDGAQARREQRRQELREEYGDQIAAVQSGPTESKGDSHA